MVRAVPLIASALLLATACGDGSGSTATTQPPGPLVATATRSSLFDSQRTFRLELRNVSDEALTVDSVQLVSSKFEDEPPSPRDTQLSPGQLLLLPLPYGPATCIPVEGPDVLRAMVDGQTVDVPLGQDPAQVMDDLHDVECAEAAVREAVDIGFGDEWTPRGPRSARGVIELTPRTEGPAPATATVEDIRGNIVFGVDVEGGTLPTTSTFPVEMTVERCDTHALIESKRTFKFPLEVSLDGGDPALVVLEATAGTPARAVFADLIRDCIG